MSFAEDVREELAHVDVEATCCRLAETSAVLRFGGTLELAGGGRGLGHVTTTTSAAVARRLHAALTALQDADRPVVEVHRPSALRAVTTYRVRLIAPAEATLRGLALVDDAGRPVAGVPLALARRQCDLGAYARGALLGAGVVSDPGSAAHLEIRAPGAAAADDLARIARRAGATGARAVGGVRGWRVVVKSGTAIGALLVRAGAHAAFLRWDGQRLRRELRGEANRVANADRANVTRSVAAAARQVESVERALAAGLDALPDDLRAIALARLANPEASLAELGALLDPPLTKSAVHRRLARLTARAESHADPQR
jgi:DNA-binding protein WhiA